MIFVGRAQASDPVWRYNCCMSGEIRCQAGKTPGAPASLTNSGCTLASEELAEFMAALEEDEVLNASADRAEYDPSYND